MDTKQILADLRTELSRINQAITALERLDSTGSHATRPDMAAPIGASQHRGRRRMSAAARKRIAEAMRKRWVERKKKTAPAKKVTASKKTVPARHMSAAARKRLSELAKKRWAKRKKQGKTTL